MCPPKSISPDGIMALPDISDRPHSFKHVSVSTFVGVV